MPSSGWQSKSFNPWLLALACAVLVILLDLRNPPGYWRSDDTAILSHVLQYQLFDIFFVPAVWQAFSPFNLTPWVSLSFAVDLGLGGLNPALFYVHHLAVVWLTVLTFGFLLALLVPHTVAVLGALLFLLGTPVLNVSLHLTTRHYLEGLLFALLALYCFLRHQRAGQAWLLGLALLCYVLAMSAKEIYVPLGVLLIALGALNARGSVRLWQVLPVMLLILLYIAWRRYMLQELVGGYSEATQYFSPAFWWNIVGTFAALPRLLFADWTPWIAPPFFLVILVGLVLRPRAWLWGGLLAGLVLLPLVPLVSWPGITAADRYLLLPWLLCCFGFVQGLAALQLLLEQRNWPLAQNWAWLVPCVVPGLLLFLHRSAVQEDSAVWLRAADAQLRFVEAQDASVAFVPGDQIASALWMLQGMLDIKRHSDPAASIPVPLVDESLFDTALPLYDYDVVCACMRDVSVTVPQRRSDWQARLRETEPLALSLRNRAGVIDWDFGPHAAGRYAVVSRDIGRLPLQQSQRGLRTSIRQPVSFRLRYEAPEGWLTYSPELLLPADGTQLEWNRP